MKMVLRIMSGDTCCMWLLELLTRVDAGTGLYMSPMTVRASASQCQTCLANTCRVNELDMSDCVCNIFVIVIN